MLFALSLVVAARLAGTPRVIRTLGRHTRGQTKPPPAPMRRGRIYGAAYAASFPLISRTRTPFAGVCTLPATMRVGCQASSGRSPSAILDESACDDSVVAHYPN